MDTPRLEHRTLGRSGLQLTSIGFGAFKIGRNVGIKYAQGYALPTDAESDRLLHDIVDVAGITYIDTAPAYGLSEERVGRALGSRNDVVISTKVGETFEVGQLRFAFDDAAVRASIVNSRTRLRREVLDLVFVHSDGHDDQVLHHSDVVSTLQDLKRRGDVRFIGFSGKSVAGALAAIQWADAIMVEYHIKDQSHASAMATACQQGVGVVVKKALASGSLHPEEAIPFVMRNPHVTSVVIGGLSLDHMQENICLASNACT